MGHFSYIQPLGRLGNYNISMSQWKHANMHIANYGKNTTCVLPHCNNHTTYVWPVIKICVFTTFQSVVRRFLHSIVAPHVLQGVILDVEAWATCLTYDTYMFSHAIWILIFVYWVRVWKICTMSLDGWPSWHLISSAPCYLWIRPITMGVCNWIEYFQPTMWEVGNPQTWHWKR